jgi:penicillin-binding protein 2
MLIFDQLKKSDSQLRILAITILSGLAILVVGLWWVQIVSTRDYQAHLEMQSFRTVRIPAVRGRILDCNGVALAENRPAYNINMFLDEFRSAFATNSDAKIKQTRVELRAKTAAREKELHRSLKREERKAFAQTIHEEALTREARYEVASNVVAQIGRSLRIAEPLVLDRTNFQRHYDTRLVLPLTVVSNVAPSQLALFQEQSTSGIGVDVEVQPVRTYPLQGLAAHLVGFVLRDDRSVSNEESFFSYRMQGYRGVVGIETAYDEQLRGKAGAKSFQVNHRGYRQSENVLSPAEPGADIVLTLDAKLQQAVEHAIRSEGPFRGATQGAAVVMDVNKGDVLAMVSVPGYNPNYYLDGFPPGELARLADSQLKAQHNRATLDRYEPGSIFKTITGLAALEAGLKPMDEYTVAPNPANPSRGIIYVGSGSIKDTATPGRYNFRKALIHSSNAYFITNGIHVAGIQRIVALAKHLHLDEKCGLNTRQDFPGTFPSAKRIASGWHDGDTANICIGQGEISVNPLQMAVMTSALANGGKVLWPRLVDRIVSQDPLKVEGPTVLPSGRVRDMLPVKPANLQIMREAMLADVEDPEGSGRRAGVPGMRVCGKTGTAQVTTGKKEIDHTTWFISFAPFESPRYAVVVMVEGGSSGGGDCAPIAGSIYRALLEREKTPRPPVMAKIN